MTANRRPPNGPTADGEDERGPIGLLGGLLLAAVGIIVLAMVPFVISRANNGQAVAPPGGAEVDQAEPPTSGDVGNITAVEGEAQSTIAPRAGVTNPAALPFGVPEVFLALTADSVGPVSEAGTGLVSPVDGAVVSEASPTISGVTSAPAGVSEVTVVVASTSLNRAWSDEPLQAELSETGATTTEWSVPASLLYENRADLWPGQYLVAITTTDADGAEEVVYGRFWAERRGPLIQLSEPIGNEIVASPDFVVSGTARDDVELIAVEVAVVDESGNWLQPDGSFRGRRTDMAAETTGLDRPATQWSLSTELRTPGRYTVFVTAYAWDGQKSNRRRTFEYRPSGTPPVGGHATILMARSLLGVPENCGDSPRVRSDSVGLVDVAEALTERGLVATATATPDRHSESGSTCHSLGTTTVSWNVMDGLREDHGWTFVSHGQTYATMDDLSAAEQEEESCGSLTSFSERGHEDAWGMFAYPRDVFSEEAQADIVSKCFAYGRAYGSEYNEVSTLESPQLVSVLPASGGHCNDAALPCFNANLFNAGRRYTPPEELKQLMRVPDGYWAIMQFYRFVTGVSDEGFERWDCSSANSAAHWTNSSELYCWDDFLDVVDSIEAEVDVTDPASIARLYGNSVSEAN